MKIVPDTIALDGLNKVPFGLDSCASTISNERSDATSIVEFNSTVQVTVTVDIPSTGLNGLLVVDTEAGEGTEEGKTFID